MRADLPGAEGDVSRPVSRSILFPLSVPHVISNKKRSQEVRGVNTSARIDFVNQENVISDGWAARLWTRKLSSTAPGSLSPSAQSDRIIRHEVNRQQLVTVREREA